MYTEYVEDLPLSTFITSLHILMGNPTTEELTVGDIGLPIDQTIYPPYPDFGIRGYYQMVNGGKKHAFYPTLTGPDILYITGVPKDPGMHGQFRLKEPKFISYWEDSRIGYLFQVVTIQEHIVI